MSKSYIFDLEKIKEIAQPIEELQSKLNQVEKDSSRLEEIQKELISFEELQFNDEKFRELFDLIHKLNSELTEITNKNISSLLSLQERLLKRYKIVYKNRLINLALDQQKVRNFGLSLIRRKTISKIVYEISYISSINLSQWLEILDSLKENSLFRKSVEKFKIYNKNLLEKKLEKELHKVPKEVDTLVVDKYKKAFLQDPGLKFETYYKAYNLKLSDKALSTRKAILQKVKEEEELEKIKKKQEEQNQVYEDYLNLSAKEFERRRRKKSREKLSEISPEANPSEKLEISNEISEKIEQFKSQFEKKYQENYLMEDDDQTDPLELIRERKKIKTEEFKKYKNHFDNE